MKFDEKNLQQHPAWFLVKKIAETLKDWEPCIVGGAVRDFFLHRYPNDLDMCSKADPEKVLQLFPQAKPLGVEFGVVLIHENGQSIEITSFRKEGLYVDGRRPEKVSWATLQEDSERRDFTINALYFKILTHELLDPTGGIQDIEKKIIRAIGNPAQRFEEDHLRILRAIRFASQLGFNIETNTWNALCEKAPLLSKVSVERVSVEIQKIANSAGVVSGIKMMIDSGVFSALFPELKISGSEKQRSQSYEFLFRLPGSSNFVWLALILPWIIELSEDELLLFMKERRFSKVNQQSLKHLMKIFKGSALGNLSFGAQAIETLEGLPSDLLQWIREWVFLSKQLWPDCELVTQKQSEIIKFQEILKVFPQGLPPKKVNANDLFGKFQSRELGMKLRQCYELQLENLELSRDEILQQIIN